MEEEEKEGPLALAWRLFTLLHVASSLPTSSVHTVRAVDRTNMLFARLERQRKEISLEAHRHRLSLLFFLLYFMFWEMQYHGVGKWPYVGRFHLYSGVSALPLPAWPVINSPQRSRVPSAAGTAGFGQEEEEARIDIYTHGRTKSREPETNGPPPPFHI